jgi:hypothetical protein
VRSMVAEQAPYRSSNGELVTKSTIPDGPRRAA